MKRFAVLALILAGLSYPTSSFAQNSPSATSNAGKQEAGGGGQEAGDPKPKVDRDAVIRRLLAEIDVSRELLARHEERERALVKEIEQAEQSYQQLSAAYRTALIEIGALRAGLQAERRALAERQAQVAELRADKEKAQRAAGKWRGRFFKSVLVTLVLAGVVVIPR